MEPSARQSARGLGLFGFGEWLAGGVGLAITLTVTRANGLVAQEPPIPVLPSLPATVRVAGLGGAGVAMNGYAGSIFSNPSGLAPIRALSLEVAFARLPDRSTYTMGAGAFRLGRFNLGGGYQYLQFRSGGPVIDNVALAGAAVYRFGGVAAGATTKYVAVEDSAGKGTSALTNDLGVTIAFFDIMALGLSVQNVGPASIKGSRLRLPTAVHFGFSFNLLDTYSNGRLLASVETVWTQSQHRRTVVGLEAGAVFYGIGLVGRIGTGAQSPDGRVSETSYGGGLVLGRAHVDYAYQPESALGKSVHLVGVRWTP